MNAVIEEFVHPFIHAFPFSEADALEFPEYESCPCCRSASEPELLVHLGTVKWAKKLALVQCPGCELVYYLNPPSAEFISRYYKERWNQSVGEVLDKPVKQVSKSSPRMAGLMADLGKVPDSDCILDVGCGNGKLMAGLAASGYTDLWGTEASPYRVAVCSARFPDRIFSGGYDGIPDDRKFDVIYSNHVVEHFHNPADAFERLAGHLTETGIIAITVPDAWEEAVPYQVLFLPHLHSFCARSLKLLGEQYGFSCLFWKGARWEELTVIYYRDPGHIKPVSDRFFAFEQVQAQASGAQTQRIREPWQSNNPSGSVAYLTLLRTEGNTGQRQKGYADLNLPQRFAATAVNLIDLILRKVRLEKLRLYLVGKRGYIRVRRCYDDGQVPIIGTRGEQAAFFVK